MAYDSVPDLLAANAHDSSTSPALVTHGRIWSYGELWEGARAAAGGLRDVGLGPGDPVVIALENGVEFFHAFFGSLVAGGIAVPVFPRSSLARLRTIAEVCGAVAIVTSVEPPPGPSSPHAGPRLVTPKELVGARPLARAVSVEPLGTCYLQYTSGTTSDPRGVVISHANLLTNIAQVVEAMAITPDDVFVSWMPIYHDMGLTLLALTPFSVGTRTVLLPADLRGMATWLAAIGKHKATFTGGSDLAFRLCARAGTRERHDLTSLRVAIDASEPVRASTLERFESAFGLHRVMMTGYGLAEATLAVTCTPRGMPIDVDGRGLVCLGRAIPGTTVAILSGEGALVRGEVGEILVRGPSVCAGYHRNPVATEELFVHVNGDRYLRTGDLGYLDGAGRLFYVARTRDLIKIGGRGLYPQEVEAVVESTPGVRLSAAVGVDAGNLAGEQLVIFAEVKAPEHRSAQELRTIAATIASALHESLGVRPLRSVLLRPGGIPRTENGKLQRGQLRDRYVHGLLAPGDVVFHVGRTPSTPSR